MDFLQLFVLKSESNTLVFCGDLVSGAVPGNMDLGPAGSDHSIYYTSNIYNIKHLTYI
jgi:hypothetical protein